jgi:hypothetical protein
MGNNFPDRSDLISFFENISHHHLCELFSIVHEIKNVLEFETESEKITFEMFSALLWKVTSGDLMIREGRSRKFVEDIGEDEYED